MAIGSTDGGFCGCRIISDAANSTEWWPMAEGGDSDKIYGVMYGHDGTLDGSQPAADSWIKVDGLRSYIDEFGFRDTTGVFIPGTQPTHPYYPASASGLGLTEKAGVTLNGSDSTIALIMLDSLVITISGLTEDGEWNGTFNPTATNQWTKSGDSDKKIKRTAVSGGNFPGSIWSCNDAAEAPDDDWWVSLTTYRNYLYPPVDPNDWVGYNANEEMYNQSGAISFSIDQDAFWDAMLFKTRAQILANNAPTDTVRSSVDSDGDCVDVWTYPVALVDDNLAVLEAFIAGRL